MKSWLTKDNKELEVMRGDIFSLTPTQFRVKHKVDISHFELVDALNRRRLVETDIKGEDLNTY
jgi:hypothetical protein